MSHGTTGQTPELVFIEHGGGRAGVVKAGTRLRIKTKTKLAELVEQSQERVEAGAQPQVTIERKHELGNKFGSQRLGSLLQRAESQMQVTTREDEMR